MSVGRICIREVDLAELDESAQTAAQRMHTRNVGTLIVLDKGSRPIGILTDRDLTVRVVAKGLDPALAAVRDVMTKTPETVYEDTPIEMALSRMRTACCRRIPVVDEDRKLVGVVSLDDIVDLLSEELSEIGGLLRSESPSDLAGA